MSEPVQQAIVLFVLAFLLGVYLIQMIRKNAHAQKYEEQIDALQKEKTKALEQLTQQKEQTQQIQAAYDQTHETLVQKQHRHQSLIEQKNNLIQTIDTLEKEKEQLHATMKSEEEQTGQIKSHIAQLEQELQQINTVRQRISETDQTIQKLEHEHQEKEAIIDSYLKEIDTLKALRKQYKESSKQLEEDLFHTKAALHQAQQKIKKTEARYAKPLKSIQQKAEAARIMALNYEYAVKEYEKTPSDHPTIIEDKLIQKLFRMPDSKSKEIDLFIRKTDAGRLVDKIRQKFLKNKMEGED